MRDCLRQGEREREREAVSVRERVSDRERACECGERSTRSSEIVSPSLVGPIQPTTTGLVKKLISMSFKLFQSQNFKSGCYT